MTSVGAEWHAIVFENLATAVGVEADLLAASTPVRELGLSSMQLMELVYLMEEELSVVLAPDSLESIVTIGDLVSCIELALELS
jgi:acyl carrier protein